MKVLRRIALLVILDAGLAGLLSIPSAAPVPRCTHGESSLFVSGDASDHVTTIAGPSPSGCS